MNGLPQRSPGLAVLAIIVGLAFAVVMLLAGAGTAAAHPLGNFTINRYVRVEAQADGVLVYYVLDMAEIPTFQELGALDPNGDGAINPQEEAAYLATKVPELAANLHLSIGDEEAHLLLQSADVALLPGQADLNILRLVALFTAPLPRGSDQMTASVRDDNYAGRLGWREVVVRAGSGTELLASTAPSEDVSDELRQYPKELLSSPLNVSGATFSFRLDPAAASAVTGSVPTAAVSAEDASRRAGSGLASYIASVDGSLPLMALVIALAAAWGALHALGPGHGKTIVAAYLVGSKASARHTLLLGATVTFTHTITVIALGLVTLYASRYVLPDRLYSWLAIGSGAVVVAVGLALLVARFRRIVRGGAQGRETPPLPAAHLHAHGPTHGRQPGGAGHPHHHGSGGDGTLTLRGILALGVSGGLLPCPSALLVILAAISLNRIAFGLLVVFSFSLGLAGVLTGIGLLVVYAGRTLERTERVRRVAGKLPGSSLVGRLAPLLSAAGVTIAGLLALGQAVGTGLPV